MNTAGDRMNTAGDRMNTAGDPMNTAGDRMNTAGDPMNTAGDVAEAGLHSTNGGLVLRTEPFTVDPGSERYLCWTYTTAEALKVNEVAFAGAPGVHHIIFARTTAPEPEGFSECNVLFRTSWQQLFTTGAGAAKLSLPSGTAHEISAGAQLLVQLHLLNVTTAEMTQAVALTMGVTDEPDTQPVHIGGFGTFKVSVPPRQTSSIVSECVLPKTARVVALLPHMHLMGTSMTFELGSSSDDMQVAYERDPWNFDAQTIDNFDMTLQKGVHTRTTCKYDNKTDETVKYGESTFDEMCFLGAFFVGDTTNCVTF
jgi:hypothetical protein